MYDKIIIVGFSLSAAIFFVLNTLDRGEFGGWLYTSTKCLPILLLCIFAMFLFANEKNVGRNTALAMLLAAAGDLFLASRSVSLHNFAAGLVPFGVSHWFIVQTMTASPKGLKYWFGGLVAILIHAAFMGVFTFGKFENGVIQTFCSVYAVMLTVTSWLAFSLWYHEPSKLSTKSRAFGYLAFVISDSLLTVDQYVFPIPKSQLYVMITYYVAQLFICLGGFYLEKEIHENALEKKMKKQ